MPVQLKIVTSAMGAPVADTERQPVHIALQEPGSGESDGESLAPFSQQDLAIVLRALDISRSVEAYFTPEEVVRLRQWGVVEGEPAEDSEGFALLGEGDINIAALLSVVQECLYSTLFSSEEQRSVLRSVLDRVPPHEALHLRLELSGGGRPQNVQLFQFPWEALCYAGSDLWKGCRVSFSRYIRHGQPVREPLPVDKLNVLVITARPKDLPVGTGDDKERILAGLESALKSNQVRVEILPQATIQALSDYLFDHTGPESPHVVHFDGHGAFGRVCPDGHFTASATAGRCHKKSCGKSLPRGFSGYLAFERPDGNAHWVSAEELADKLRGWQVRLAVLNACASGVGRRGEDVFNGVAQSLIRSVPAVVATPFRLDWEAALRFAGYFYRGLGRGQPLVEIMDRARQAIYSQHGIEREWYRPVLYLRQGDDEGGRLFEPKLAHRQEAPLVYIHNFRGPPSDVPPEAIQLDWSDRFTAQPRQVPDPSTWERELLPELEGLKESIGDSDLIRLRGTSALSTGFVFGHTFLEVSRYRLEVAQFFEGTTQFWSSDEKPPAGADPPEFASHVLPGSPTASDGVVIVHALHTRPVEAVVRQIGDYLGEPESFEEFMAEPGQPQVGSQRFKGVLVLEAEAAAREKRPLSGWEAAGLARTSRWPLTDFVSRTRPERLHVFLATALGMAVFLGHQWNAIGKPVQCYEWLGDQEGYTPSCLLWI